jgi:hypothetical protein
MTIGWVREDAIERFLEGTEPSLHTQSGNLQNWFECPHCGHRSTTMRALYDHLGETHVVRRPTLLLTGREPPSLEEVRRPFAVHEIEALDCDRFELSIDHGPLLNADVAMLSRAISETGMRRVEVTLASAAGRQGIAADKTYVLKVFLPTSTELAGVDRLFVNLFGAPRPHISAIPELSKAAEGKATESYAAALAEYVRGVLAKDRDPTTGIHGDPIDWTDAYKRSLRVLSLIDRPLPTLIAGIIRFSLNDFSHWRVPTEFFALDHSVRILGSLANGLEPKLEPAPVEPDHVRGVCPIDAGVSRVIELGARYSKLDRWSAIDATEASRLSELRELGAYDRAKSRALWAWAALRLGATSEAMKPLGAIQGNDTFGAWAQSQLYGADL